MKGDSVQMRYPIGLLCAVALLFGAAPNVAAAGTVGCGRVTTFAPPNSASSLNNGDGWIIYAKPDGTSNKVIIRSGTLTPDGSIAGYVCLDVDGFYFIGVLAPGTAGYIPEPANWVTGTGVYCGTVALNPFTTGQLSGPNTFQLAGLSAFSLGIFSVPASLAPPRVGDYLCGRFEVGGPSRLIALLAVGDPGYVAGLPNTSTSSSSKISTPTAGALSVVLVSVLLLIGVGLAIVALKAGRTTPRP